jgi:hypothetical protein
MYAKKTALKALNHYYMFHDVSNFEYGGYIGKKAFELYCTVQDEFFLEFICAYLDLSHGIEAEYPKIKEIEKKFK